MNTVGYGDQLVDFGILGTNTHENLTQPNITTPEPSMLNSDMLGSNFDRNASPVLPQAQPKLMATQSQPNTQNAPGVDFEFGDFDDFAEPQQASQKGSFVAFQDDNISLTFDCTKTGNLMDINALYGNKSAFLLENFYIKIAAAKHLSMNLMPLNTNQMRPGSSGEMSQVQFHSLILSRK